MTNIVSTTTDKIGHIVIVNVCGQLHDSVKPWGTLTLSSTVPRAHLRYNSLLTIQDTVDPRILLSVSGTLLFIESKGPQLSTGIWIFGQLVYVCE